MLVDLALDRSRRRPPISALPIGLQRDIRSFFSSYTYGYRRADDRRFRSGDADAVGVACRRSAVGKLLPNALYVHRTALDALDPLLRVDEGCARADLGAIDGANLIKLHRQSGTVSYLVYPDFDADPHPALLRSIKLNLRTRAIESTDYASSAIPPVLHRKETFLLPDDPRWPTFDRRTRQEERAGWLDDAATVGTRSGWAERLRERGFALRGHRLVRSRAGDMGGDPDLP